MTKTNRIGVVVCRFQVPQLHEGHKYLLDTVKRLNDKLLIVVGVSGGWTSKNDPMNFETRAVMIKSQYPEALICPILDHPSLEAWSNNLDELIALNSSGMEATLYGSRDSFLPFYMGRYRTEYIEPKPFVSSGTEVRDLVSSRVIDSEDFRSGVIYASTKQNFPTSFQVVDIAIRHSTERKVIVGRKPGEKEWRFPGGFIDPKDHSLEYSAKREAREEVGDIEIADVKYLSSTRIDDHRYRKSEHKIMTALFSAVYIFGGIKAGDDLAEVRWQDFDGLIDCLLPEHKHLGEIFLRSLQD
ncbi:MAG: NUDIX domain-containing protein [Nitrospira sp.]